MARPEKVAAVDEIRERFEGADAALLTEYRGLRVSEIAELRDALRGAGADYKVMKNTLARIAVREVGLEDLVGMLEGPTAVAFVEGDVAAAAKVLDDAAKKFPVLIVKGGVLKGGKTFDAEQAQALAKIEPREVLLAKVAMLANAPAQQTANVLSALLRNFGSMLAQVVSKKEAGETFGGEGSATVTPEEVGVPSPEGDTPEEKGTSSEEEPTPSATADPGKDEASPAEDEASPAEDAAEEASAGEAAAPISSSDEDE